MIQRHIPRPMATQAGDPVIRPLTERPAHRGDDSLQAEPAGRLPRNVLYAVALVALFTNAASLAASHLWIYPDSIDYFELAGRLLNGFDLRDELYLIRTPAYPFLLAGIFKVFGAWSPEAILVLQHLMAIGTALLLSAISWHLTRHRIAALLAGLLCAGSVQLLAYANLALTEAPFALVLTAYVYFLVRFMEEGRWRTFACASALCGMAYLLRPVGLCLLGPCMLAGWLRVHATPNIAIPLLNGKGVGRIPPRWLRSRSVVWKASPVFAWSVLPAFVVAGPWMIVSRSVHHGAQASRCLDYVLYLRAASFDGLDSTQSTALRDIKTALEEAKERGLVPSQSTYRDRPAVERALRTVRGANFADRSELLGRAGRDLMREHPWPTFANTFRYAAWMILDADPVYRFVPGGEPGRNGGRAKDADLFDIATYSVGEGSWQKTLDRFAAYLPLETQPRTTTPAWTALMRSFYRSVDRAPGLTQIADTRFAELMLLCGLGGGIMLFSSRRAAWTVVLSVIASHVLLSAFLGGPQTRYAVPVKPLILMCGVVGLTAVIGCMIRVLRRSATVFVGVRHARAFSASL